MARLRQSSPDTTGGSRVQGGKEQLDPAVRIASLQRSVAWHDQEIREAPHRDKGNGMPEEMVALHKQTLVQHHLALAELGVVAMITDRPEVAEHEPVRREASVPAQAMPALVPATA